MIARIEKWRNSIGINLSKQVLDEAGLAVGDEVEVVALREQITIRKVRRKQFDLSDLVARTPRTYRGGEKAFGPPAGKELW